MIPLFTSLDGYAQSHSVPDSANLARQKAFELARKERKRVADSINAVRLYKESKPYKDSIERIRQEIIAHLKANREEKLKELNAERKRISDSTQARRKAITEQRQLILKRRADSLMAIKTYKSSKRYLDSVAIVKQGRMDSIRIARKNFTDSVSASRKAIAQNLLKDRKQGRDSLQSTKKQKSDNIAKTNQKKQVGQKVKVENEEKKKQLALELKIKQKRSQYNNEDKLKKKWGLPRQIVQNTFTRYNYYFNADKRMDEALQNMQRMRRENYDSLLALFPFDPDRDSSALAPDMDSIIQKASLGIQIHDPRVKWGDDLYLLLGEAYFYKGNYKEAAASFRYVLSLKRLHDKEKMEKKGASKKSEDKLPSIAEAEKKGLLEFLRHQTVHNEALLWLTRTYTQWNKKQDAESVIDLLAADPNFPDDLKGRLALEKAFLYLKDNRAHSAIEQLNLVIVDETLPSWIRLRAAYLNGQLQQRSGEYVASASSFRQVIDLHPKIEMDFYARKQLAYSLMYAGGNQQEGIASLKTMLHDGKYAPYYEQIYYVLGRLSANGGQTKDAIAYLRKSIDAPKSTKKQKAMSFSALGNVYYDAGNYPLAKQSYDSAAALSMHAQGDDLVAQAIRRSKTLNDVMGPYYSIHSLDSLLALSALSEKDQHLAVRRYIRKLEDEKADSVFRAENGDGPGNIENAGDNNAYSNWYFTNPVLIQQGSNEFKRKWGSRPLVDNWRRAAATGMSNNTVNQEHDNTESETETQAELGENGIPTESSLMAAIPNTAERKEMVRLRITRAYIDLANAYIRQLEDYPRATETLDSLDLKYPVHPHKAEELYMRYLVSLRQNKLAEAQQYSEQLRRDFPESKFSALVKPTEDTGGPDNGNPDLSAYYDETYQKLMDHRYAEAIQRSRMAIGQYNDPKYNNRFTVLQASAMAGAQQYGAADSLASDFIKNNPADPLVSWAEKIRDYILRNRPKITKPAMDSAAAKHGDSASRAQAVTLPKDSTGLNNPLQPEVPGAWSFKPAEEHYFVFVFPKMESRALDVRTALTDFNNNQYSNQGLNAKMEVMKNQKGIIVVQKFAHADYAKIYMNALKSSPQVFKGYSPDEYTLLIISARNYLKLMADRDADDYQKFYKSRYQ